MTPLELVELLSEGLKRMTPTNTTPATAPIAPSTTPSSTTSMAAASTSASSTPFSAPLAHPSAYAGGPTSNQCGSTCGIIIGSIVGGILLVTICIALYVTWRRRRAEKQNKGDSNTRESITEVKVIPSLGGKDNQWSAKTRSWLPLSRPISELRWGSVDRHHVRSGYVDLESGHLSSRVEGLRIGDDEEVHAR